MIRFLLICYVAICALCLWGASYTTSFPLDEDPMSEGGRWVQGGTVGLLWSDIRTSGGRAYNKQSGGNGFDDGTAILTGEWGADQDATIVAYWGARVSGMNQEVEIRLRSNVAANSNTGYEILWGHGYDYDYHQIWRWDGGYNQFTSFYQEQHSTNNGDVLRATITGTNPVVITTYINGVQAAQISDSSAGRFTTGNPGIGMYQLNGYDNQTNYGIESFDVTDGLGNSYRTRFNGQVRVNGGFAIR